MPDVAWPDIDGKLVHVKDFAGKPVLVNAWATWCPPCKAEMPLLQDLYNKYQDQGLVVLAVNGAEELNTVQGYLKNNPFTFPVLLDPSGEAINKLGIINFPTSILVGRDGVVQYIYTGEITPKAMQEVVIPLLKLNAQ
jgi:cytochrome c biogenesis protein CcmG, thiol:disulfide interchange protein DsbE